MNTLTTLICQDGLSRWRLQTRARSGPRGSNGVDLRILIPDGNTTLFVNRWFRSQSIKQTRLLPCYYHGETIFLAVTDRKLDGNGTSNDFEAFREREKAC